MLVHVLLGLSVLVTCVNAVPKECRALMELVFVIDGSDSIMRVDYQKQRKAIEAIIDQLSLGVNRTRVGMVVYSSRIAQIVNVTDDKKTLIHAARKMVHPREGTNTNLGIEKMIKMFNDHGRKNVPYVGIIITDGISKYPELTAKEAAKAKAMHVNMFAVGISHTVLKAELLDIASSPDQVLTLQSFDQLQASLSSLMKVVCPCPVPPHVLFASVDDRGRAIDVRITYACEKGYQPIGNPEIICQKDATWSPLDFGCYDPDETAPAGAVSSGSSLFTACTEPMPVIGNAIIMPGPPGDLRLGATREYVCDKGYTSPVPLITSCNSSPKGPIWTDLPDVCIGCGPPHIPPFAAPVGKAKKSTLIGETWGYACAPGYVPSGPLETSCVDNKGIPEWTPVGHGCITCPEPPPIPFAMVDKSGDVLVNARRAYMCQEGYHPTGPLEAVCVGGEYSTHWEVTKHSCIGCGNPNKVPNARLETPLGHLVGTNLIYSCIRGFQETGPIGQVCMAKAGKTYWAGPDHGCVACAPPPILPNAVVNIEGDTLVGSIRNYHCMNGYINNGPLEVGCIKGTGGPLWTAPEYHCVHCDMPPSLPNARKLDIGSRMVGEHWEYECLPGYVPSKPGYIAVKCIGEYKNNRGRAIWTPPSHECIACAEPPLIEHGKPDPGAILVGTSRRYKCLDGFFATGPIITICMNNTKWSRPKHACKACGPLPKIPFAKPLGGPFLIGTTRKYICLGGYVPDSDPAIKCLPNAKWSPAKFKCNKCNDPYPIKNGVLEPGKTFVDTVRAYKCLPGYVGTGPITSTCFVPDGTMLPDWSVPVHSCRDCGEPVPVPFAIPMPGPRTVGSLQAYKCEKGFVPSGPPVSQCSQSALWSLPNFKCITCEDPPVIANSMVDKVGGVKVGDIRTYACIQGYLATGPIEFECIADLTVDLSAAQPPYWKDIRTNYCKDCGEPYPIANGGWLPGPITTGSVAHYICDKGYAPNGPPEASCLETAVWTKPSFECSGCFSPPILPYAQIKGYKDGDMALVGHAYTYVCLKGYRSAGVVKVTCLDDLGWSVPSFSCGGCDPGLVPLVPNGDAVTKLVESTVIGKEVLYKCHKGYLHTKHPAVLCGEDLQWSVPAFECVVTCYDPPTYTDAMIDKTGRILVGDTRTYQCNEGLHSVGGMSITCDVTGQWSPRSFECLMCTNPPGDLHAIAIDAGPRLLQGKIHYECSAGYVPTGKTFVSCMPGAVWSPLVIGCSNCLVPPDLHLSRLVGTVPDTGILVGQTLDYECLQGFFSDVPVSTTCQLDLLWSKPTSVCRGCDVSLIPKVDNGAVLDELKDMQRIGTRLIYQCSSGHLPTEKPYVFCLDTVQWSVPRFQCVVTCYDPPIFDDATVDAVGGIFLGNSRVYACRDGLHSVGNMEITCLPTGKWSPRTFKCLRCVDPPVKPHTYTMDVSPRLLGETVQYQCDAGYAPTGEHFITCLPGAVWSPLTIGCSNCRNPPKLPYAEMSVIDHDVETLIGVSLMYPCMKGYASVATVSVTCQPDLTWSVATDICRGCDGALIPGIEHATLDGFPEVMSQMGTKLLYICAPGFLPTDTPHTICLDTLQWAAPLFRCAVNCGEPQFYSDALFHKKGGVIEGSVWTYMCKPGTVLVGDRSVTCLVTGLWSPRMFECRVCDPPPEFEHAFPMTKTWKVGSEVLYKCRHGYIAKGPVASKCHANLTWSIPSNSCFDCGPPPKITNSYVNLGSTTIGSKRQYACDTGYEMSSKSGIIECLPSGVWTDPGLFCMLTTTTTTTTPAPVRHDPSVCDNCRMINGVGYNPHPADCTKYVQCFYGATGGIEAVYMPCPFGQFWYHPDLSCKPAEIVDCPTDRCIKNPSLHSYKHTDSEKCCAYWKCVNGKSVAKCCGEGFRYKPGKECVPDPTCMAVCPHDDYFPVCDRRPLLDITRYEVHIGNGHWIKMPCAPGTAFDAVNCECSLSTDIVPNYVCRPELKLDFEDDSDRDKSGKNVYILNQGVRSSRGVGYFNGSARLLINRFSNTPFHDHLVIKLRYREELKGPTAGSLQALVTNGDCGDDPTVIMAKMPGFVLLGVHTDSPKSFALPTVDKEWKEVILIHDERKLEGKVCGASYSKWSYGPIKSTHCGIQIGYGTKLPNFMGWMDDIYLYQCRPSDRELSVYGGLPVFGGDNGDEKLSLRQCNPRFLCLQAKHEEVLTKCLDLVSDMYKLNFEPKDYCAKPEYRTIISEDVNGDIHIKNEPLIGRKPVKRQPKPGHPGKGWMFRFPSKGYMYHQGIIPPKFIRGMGKKPKGPKGRGRGMHPMMRMGDMNYFGLRPLSPGRPGIMLDRRTDAFFMNRNDDNRNDRGGREVFSNRGFGVFKLGGPKQWLRTRPRFGHPQIVPPVMSSYMPQLLPPPFMEQRVGVFRGYHASFWPPHTLQPNVHKYRLKK